MLRSKKNIWWFHLVGWLLFACLPLIVMSREPVELIYLRVLSSPYFWLFVLIYAGIFYLNSEVLVPKFFFPKRYGLYFLSCVVLFVFVFYTKPFESLVFDKFHGNGVENEIRGNFRPLPPHENSLRDERHPPPPSGWPRREERIGLDFVSLILFVVVWVVSLAVTISKRWRNTEKQIMQSEADKAQAELSFFKAQINPHFLFNTLNNIYALAVSQHENTAPSVLRLSQMMRYITEEATEDFVPLAEEIACVRNYIDLQNLRLNEMTQVDLKVSGEMANSMVTPLIFITFIENAFKYGVSGHFEARIYIKIDVDKDGISFYCRNPVFKSRAKDDRVGIGIANTKKRLEYLYNGRHNLDLDQTENSFTVRLRLENGRS